MQVIKECYNEDRTETVSIRLSHPTSEEEECPISSEVIGSTAYEPPYVAIHSPETPSRKKTKYNDSSSAATRFFSDHPTLSCAEMVLCGHRFDVRALLIHFMRNSMSCPLCRAGVSNGSVLSCKTSFPQEKWICEAENRIQIEKAKEENLRQQEDEMLAGSLQIHSLYYQMSIPSMILNTLQAHSVIASLFFYDMPVSSQANYHPIHGMQFEMELLPLELRHRDLSRGISLYSSFSSNSIETPPSPQTSIRRTIRSPPETNQSDVVTQNLNDPNNTIGEEDTIPLLIPYSGSVSLDDISVHYAMSDSTLR